MDKSSCSKSLPKKKLPMVRPGMKKTAQDTATSFNETVPSTDTGMPQLGQQQGQPVNQKNTVVNEASDPYAVVPQEQEQGQDMGMQQDFSAPPEMIGAAQSFLGPEVMQSAMSGDSNAQDLIARTAAQVGSTFMTMASNSALQAQPAEMEQGDINAQQNGAAPQGITSPEDDLASELIPNIEQQPANPAMQQGNPGENTGNENNENNENSETGETVDAKTVAKLIQLAKAGKI